MPVADDTGRAIRCAAHAPLTRAELGRRTSLPWIELIRGARPRKDAKQKRKENRQHANHGPNLSKPCLVTTIQSPAGSALRIGLCRSVTPITATKACVPYACNRRARGDGPFRKKGRRHT